MAGNRKQVWPSSDTYEQQLDHTTSSNPKAGVGKQK
jgi:hypothetical protein